MNEQDLKRVIKQFIIEHGFSFLCETFADVCFEEEQRLGSGRDAKYWRGAGKLFSNAGEIFAKKLRIS